MLVGLGRSDAPARAALEETALDEVGLVDVLDGPHLFRAGDGQRLDAYRAAVIMMDDHFQQASVHLIEPQRIYIHALHGLGGLRAGDGPVSVHERKIPHAPEQTVGDAGRAA